MHTKDNLVYMHAIAHGNTGAERETLMQAVLARNQVLKICTTIQGQVAKRLSYVTRSLLLFAASRYIIHESVDTIEHVSSVVIRAR